MTTQLKKNGDEDSGYETFSEHSYDEEKDKDVEKPKKEGQFTFAWDKFDSIIKEV
jgi:hypothetical protein